VQSQRCAKRPLSFALSEHALDLEDDAGKKIEKMRFFIFLPAFFVVRILILGFLSIFKLLNDVIEFADLSFLA
jgi:hypothetical protein